MPPRLSIVVPALNEEDAIASTLARCLDARRNLVESAQVRDVEILVVSDGSTDKTEEIAYSFDDVTVLTFEKNRGYGAAIKCGFEHATGELVGFLDADGTCDPNFFGNLIRELEHKRADLALGSRMGDDSKMPLIRTVGNHVFASLLSVFSMQRARDTASGMRVIRRDALPHLYPLPDGLHFTPAMSARALLEGRLKLIEVPMPYAERVGQSKLRVLSDGLRFLSIIVRAAVTFRPARPLLLLAACVSLLALLTGLYPVTYYLRHARLEEWVIYRVLLSSLCATVAWLLVCTAALADRVAAAAHGRWTATSASEFLHRMFSANVRGTLQVLMIGSAIAVIWPGITEYVQTTHVQMHWSRAILGSLLFVSAVMLSATGFLLRMMDFIEVTRSEVPAVLPPDRLRPRSSAPPSLTQCDADARV